MYSRISHSLLTHSLFFYSYK